MDRITQLAAWLPEGADAALVLTPVSRLYLTGFASSDGMLLITRGEAVLAVDGRYAEAAGQKAQGCQVLRQNPQPGWLLQWLKGKGVGSLLLEAAVTVEQFNRMQKSLDGIKLCADGTLDQKLRAMRAVKSPQEVALIEPLSAFWVISGRGVPKGTLPRGWSTRCEGLAVNGNPLKP